MNNRFIRVWNVELLRVAGIVARVSWGNETSELRAKLSQVLKTAGRKQVVKDDIMAVLPETLYLHNTFTWNESTPSSEVGTLMEEAFWTCNQKTTIATLSTQGVLPSSQVRIAPEDFGFVEGIPFLPEALAGVGIIKKLIDYGVITEVTISDIKSELEGKAMNAAQLRRFLEWLGHKAKINEIDGVMIRSLLDVAIANDDEDDSGRVIVLAEMKNFLNVSRIPPEMPIPPNTIPFKFTKKISKPELEMLGLEDLHLVPWLRWLIENTGGRGDLSTEQDITVSAAFASSVLPIISKQWDGLSQSSKSTVVELLTPRTVIPTKMGMKKPAESYFPSVKLFDDLPVVVGLHSVKDKLLVALQVRKTIDIGVVFDRLMDLTPSTAPNKTQIPVSVRKWNHVDLIKYLASVQSDIPAADIKRLRTMKICPAETEALQPSAERYQASELFEPDQALRRLKLRTMHWPGIYRPESQEGRFLKVLGLRPYPSYTDLIQIMSAAAANGDIPLRDHALRYFIDYHQTKGYAQYDHSSVTSSYLPIEGSEKKVATPNECFSNERAAIMGFDILRRDLHVHALKFGVKPDPPIAECVSRLISNPPQSKRNARELFAYFASRLPEMHDRYTETLSGASIVPVVAKSSTIASPKSGNSERIVHIPPRVCFLGNGEKYADIFDYVDFGPEANTFLLRVGSKHEPSTIELTKLLVREPARIFSVLGDTRYLELLRTVAASWRTLRKDKALVKDMKAAKCLLAYREISSTSSKGDYEEEEESGIKSWELANASQVVIVDDIITYNLFKSSLLAAPMEDVLEEFYNSLGTPEVTSLLEEQQSIGIVAKDQSSALKLQQLIQERSRLFLHGYPSEMVKHNAKWIEQNLKVKCVQTIALRRSLQGYNLSHRESRSAVVHSDKPILYIISQGYDMLEVSQALVPVLLQRSKPQSIFMLEMILESSLHKLRSRGYNVGRIMQQKETEARLADEALKQQQEEQQREIRDREAAWKEAHAASAAKAQQNAMPGIFPDSPDRSNVSGPVEEEPIIDRPRGLFSGIRKQFGFDHHRRSAQNTPPSRGRDQDMEAPHEDAPPPYTQNEGHKSQTQIPQPETVTAPHHLQQNLVNAIRASRAHNSTSVISQPAVNEVKEAGGSYCDSRPGQDISFIGKTSDVRIFLSNTVAVGATKFMEANVSALKLFATILLECADVFLLSASSVHIFYDDAGSTIAFNQNKALFFNYRYFENLHLPVVQQGDKKEAIVYWSVVMAHELSHNLVTDHSAQHSYYTEAMVIQYFRKIASKIGGQGPPLTSTGGPSLPPDPIRSIDPQNRLVDID